MYYDAYGIHAFKSVCMLNYLSLILSSSKNGSCQSSRLGELSTDATLNAHMYFVACQNGAMTPVLELNPIDSSYVFEGILEIH